MLNAPNKMGSFETEEKEAEEVQGVMSYVKKLWYGFSSSKSTNSLATSLSLAQQTEPSQSISPRSAPVKTTTSPRKRSHSIGKNEGAHIRRTDDANLLAELPTVRRKRRSLTAESFSRSAISHHNDMLKNLVELSIDSVDISANPAENCARLLKAKNIGTFLQLFRAIAAEDLVQYIQEHGFKEGVKALKEFQKKIQHYAKMGDDDISISAIEQEFHNTLKKKRLTEDSNDKILSDKTSSVTTPSEITEKLKPIFNQDFYPPELTEALYALCTGLNTENRELDIEKSRHIIIGLISKFSSSDILDILYKILPNLNKNHQLNALCVMKEIILWDEFNHIYRNEQVIAECPFQDKELLSMLNQLAQYKRKKESSLFQISIKINSVLATCYRKSTAQPSSPGKVTTTEGEQASKSRKKSGELISSGNHHGSKKLANHFRAMTLLFYQTLNFREFAEEQKDEVKRRESERAKTFNLLSQYVIADILNEQYSHKECIAHLGYYIRTMTALLEGDEPDLNSAMIISSAINSSWISNLKFLFEGLPKEDADQLKAVNEKLSFDRNFHHQRSLMSKPYALPYVGIITRDLTFGGENTFLDKAELTGKVYLELMQRQDRLTQITSPLDPALCVVVDTWKMKSDDEMKCLAQHLFNKPFVLDETTTIRGLQGVFDYFIKNKLQLAFVYDEPNKNGDVEKSVKALFDWLTCCYTETDTTVTLKIINLAMECFERERVLHYQENFARNQQRGKELTLQYSRAKTNIASPSRGSKSLSPSPLPGVQSFHKKMQ